MTPNKKIRNLLFVTQKVDENDQLLGFSLEWLRRLTGQFENIIVLCLEKGNYSLPDNITVISLGKDRNIPRLLWFFNFYNISNARIFTALFVSIKAEKN